MSQEENQPMSIPLPPTQHRWHPLAVLAIACAGLAAGGSQAQVIYKSVDSTGRVIYSQEPVSGAVSVDKVDVTPKVTVDRPAGGASAPNAAAEAKRSQGRESRRSRVSAGAVGYSSGWMQREGRRRRASGPAAKRCSPAGSRKGW